MIKFLCVGDIHYKILDNVPLDWQLDRYRQLNSWIVQTCTEKGYKLILAGDQLDSIRPKKEEQQLFLNLLHRLNAAKIATYMVSGNHETIAVGKSRLDYLELQWLQHIHYLRGNVVYTDIASHFALHVLHHDELTLHKPEPVAGCVNILASHFRADYNKWVREEVDVAALTEGFDVVIAGDIHDAFQFDNIWYTNNPINKEFEANPNCGYLVLEVGRNAHLECSYEKLDFPALRKTSCSVEEWPCKLDPKDFWRVEVHGPAEELRDLDEVDFAVDIVRVPDAPKLASVETSLGAESEVSLDDGLPPYLGSLEGSSEEDTQEMMTFFAEEIAV